MPGSVPNGETAALLSPTDSGYGEDDAIFQASLDDFVNIMNLGRAEKLNYDLMTSNTRLKNEKSQVEEEKDRIKRQNEQLLATITQAEVLGAGVADLEKKRDELAKKVEDSELQLQMTRLSISSNEETQRIKAAKDAELEQLQCEIDELHAQVRETTAQCLTAHSENTKLRVQTDKHLGEIDHLRSKVEDLNNENQQLKQSNNDSHDLRTENAHLMDRIDKLLIEKDKDKDRIRRLSSEIPCLSETNDQLDAEITRKCDENSRLSLQIYSLEAENGGLKSEVTALTLANQSYKKKETENTKELGKLGAQNAELIVNLDAAKAIETTLRYQKTTTYDENVQLRATNKTQHNEIVALKAQLTTSPDVVRLKTDLAFYVTQLDLADHEARVFTCQHNRLKDVPDGKKSTREKDLGVIAQEMFQGWAHDQQFVDEYQKARQFVINHHRAHERQDVGRGDWAWELKNIFVGLDSYRNPSLSYV
ncbi:hypothetical protein N0V90_000110 [Kalmusia sp. IMI 367209]|nr:hypothetical protein N0V90_000110 [Kalmusia sp. IMI 367209]